jgi:hypothetical protein
LRKKTILRRGKEKHVFKLHLTLISIIVPDSRVR